MPRGRICLILLGAMLLLGSTYVVAQAQATPPPRPSPTYKACHICEEEAAADALTPTMSPQATVTATPVQTPDEASGAVARAILFTTLDCRDCQIEAGAALTPVREKYGAHFEYRTIDIVTPDDVGYLYQVAAHYGFSREQVDLPLLVIGSEVLIGEQMAAGLSDLVATYLAAGGVDWPSLPAQVAAGQTVAPTDDGFGFAAPRVEGTGVPLNRRTDSAPIQGEPVTVYFFWGDGCPHCAEAEPFLADLAQRYPGVQVRDFEVWYHEENREPLIRMAAKFGFEPTAVPTIFLSDRHWVGFARDPIGKEIEAAVAACVASGCPDAGAGVLLPAPAATMAPVLTQVPDAPTSAATQPESGALPGAAEAAESSTLTLPLIGSVDLATQSLALSTALIAFVDGFNPCSLWVLSVLLALTLHTGSRKKVLIIGLVFLTVTSLVYVLFIAGLFTMFTIVSFAPWIRIVVALFALFFAAVNIKDYFWYKEGVSFTIADEKKPGLYRSMRRVLDAGDSMPALIGATVVMSAGASLVEFMCTAGFPVLWTNLLASQGVTVLTFVVLLALYMLIYQIDEIAIFLAAVFSLRASKLEEKHGRVLKLAGGMLMLTLALVMLVNPSLMSQVGTALIVFGVAFAATALVLLVHRSVLPRLGVRIGSEFTPTRGRRRRASS